MPGKIALRERNKDTSRNRVQEAIAQDSRPSCAEAPVQYNFTPNALFRSRPDTSVSACVGENSGHYDLLDYGRGFFGDGSLIAAGPKAGKAPVDIVVYPAAFAYRHGIVLSEALTRDAVLNALQRARTDDNLSSR